MEVALILFYKIILKFPIVIMEDGGVDTTVIESWQHKMGQMADFLPLLASSVFDS